MLLNFFLSFIPLDIQQVKSKSVSYQKSRDYPTWISLQGPLDDLVKKVGAVAEQKSAELRTTKCAENLVS
jgi:hypothetical protein